MYIIETVNTKQFSLDGIPYFKNYISRVTTNGKLSIFNCYDSRDVLVEFTDADQFEVNGVTYTDVAALQAALINVLYTRGGSGGGSVGDLQEVTENGNETNQGIVLVDEFGNKVRLEGSEEQIVLSGISGVSQYPIAIISKQSIFFQNGLRSLFLKMSATGSGHYIFPATTSEEQVASREHVAENYVPYTGANQNVDLGDNKIITNKGIEVSDATTGKFRVNRDNPNYDSLYFESNDISEDDFGKAIVTVDAETGANLLAQNQSGSKNAGVGISQSRIEFNVNEVSGNSNSFGVESTRTDTNKPINLPKVEFNSTTETAAEKQVIWNDADGTVEIGLKGGNVKLQVGQEQVTRVVNDTGVNLLESNYQIVRVSGAQGNRLKVALAQATTDLLSAETIGMVTETIDNNQEGFITTSGLVRNINTTGSLQGETWADGDILYLSPTVAGRATKVKPEAPNHLVVIGYVVRAHATQGQIYVKVDNGYELDELHNVKITAPTNNQSLVYNSALQIWENNFPVRQYTTAERDAITPVVGVPIFNTTEGYLEIFDNFWGWMPVSNQNEWKRKWGLEYFNDLGVNTNFSDGVFFLRIINGAVTGLGVSPLVSNYIGLQALSTGTSSNAQAQIRTDSNIGRYFPNFSTLSGRKQFETRIAIHNNLSDAADRYNFVAGFTAQENSTINNGCVFVYDEGGVGTGTIATPNWQIITANGGVRSVFNTGIPVNINQFYKLRIETNANTTEIYYYINDVLVRTENTNIPIANFVQPLIGLTKTAGTTQRGIWVDYLGLKVKLTNAR